MISTQKCKTREERRSFGRSLRNKVSRVDQGKWNARKRDFRVVELLQESVRGRMPELLPLKFGRMSQSPFSFFRGAVAIMAADLSKLPCTELHAQICGDAHVQNLGAFEAPDGRLIFDINDFDETIRGPWEWDVKRMAASLVLAGREAGNPDKECKTAVLSFARSYRESLGRFSEMPVVELARFQIYRAVTPVLKVLRKAERCTPEHNLSKLTVLRNKRHIFREQKPLQFHVTESEVAEVLEGLRKFPRSLLPERAHFFSQYQAQDLVFRVVGTGSVGLRDYVVFMCACAISDPLFIQIKEELTSAYAQYLPVRRSAHQGRRVAEGQRLMQMQSDIFLGWTSIAGRDYVVRQLRDHKAAIAPADLKGDGLEQYALVCGELLSKGHARSGDPSAISGYLGNSGRFDEAIADFAVTYADQTAKDYAEFMRAVRAGKIRIRTVPGASAAARSSSGRQHALAKK